jgi:hypothetical protein
LFYNWYIVKIIVELRQTFYFKDLTPTKKLIKL